MPSGAETSALRTNDDSPDAGDSADLQIEVIEFFVHIAQLLHLPKSIGQIFGYLFCAGEPRTFDDIVRDLSVSKGSASQGLRFLRNLNAVRVIYIPGNRRDHFEAEDRLSKLAAGFLRERVEPQLEVGQERLARLKNLVERRSLSDDADLLLRERVGRLEGWNSKARQIVPVMLDFLGI